MVVLENNVEGFVAYCSILFTLGFNYVYTCYNDGFGYMGAW